MDILDLKKGLVTGDIAGVVAAIFCFALGCWMGSLSPSSAAPAWRSGVKLALAGFLFFGPAIGLIAAARPEFRKRPGKRD